MEWRNKENVQWNEEGGNSRREEKNKREYRCGIGGEKVRGTGKTNGVKK